MCGILNDKEEKVSLEAGYTRFMVRGYMESVPLKRIHFDTTKKKFERTNNISKIKEKGVNNNLKNKGRRNTFQE